MADDTRTPDLDADGGAPLGGSGLEGTDGGAAVQPVAFGPLDGAAAGGDRGKQNLDLLLDVEIPVAVEVGRAAMTLDAIVQLVPGAIVPLDKKAEEPVDLRVNGKLVARGEVVLVDDVYGLRITQIIDAAGRIASLKS